MTTIEKTLHQRIAELEKQLAQATARNKYLEEQFRLAQQKQFGQSAEGFVGQGELFNEVEEIAEQDEVAKQDISYSRNKPKRKPLPEDLPREVIVHDLAEEEKICVCCDGQLHKIGEDKAEKLEFIPAKAKIIEHVRPKYACRQCEKTGISNTIKQAPVPPSPIPKGFATPTLITQIITSKYQYGLPLYRQESMFKQYGIELSRQTMSDWVIKSAKLFQLLYDLLREVLLTQGVIQADETTLNVVSDDNVKSYMWLYCTGADTPVINSTIPNIVLFDYRSSRAGRCPVEFLQGYSGYLQVDGYQGYEKTQATLAGCMAHARRKFKEAGIVQPKGKSGKVNWVLNHIQKLYGIEAKIKGRTTEEKHQIRQADSKPLLDQFKAWLDKSAVQVIPKSKLGEAIRYSLNQWSKLTRYIEDGQLNIDNNRAERSIKPFVIGRKNWLFSQTAEGANASAVLYSIVETAKANGLVPFDYISHCLEQLCQPEPDVESLLPWNVNLGGV